MVTHVVLFKLKDRSPDNALRVRDLLREMKGRIPPLLDLEAGVDYVRSTVSYDVALITRHADRAALDAYQVHPIHERVKLHLREVCDLAVATDFDC